VQCVEGTLWNRVKKIRSGIAAPKYTMSDDVVPLTACLGCGVAISTRPTLSCRSDLAKTSPQSEFRRRDFGGRPRLRKTPRRAVACAGRALRRHRAIAGRRLRRLRRHRRCRMTQARGLRCYKQSQARDCQAPISSSALQCGGSDAFSGVTANPALGSPRTFWCARARPRDVLGKSSKCASEAALTPAPSTRMSAAR